ncbi:anthrone oxygenase family protein [Mycolicibacterium arseniciresistens]|uniref:DUF1772 domain-containing protein n=1 Tax=Mycolicibacterium arseniciresistens TaxID=3062257 RepID=A0ABT8UUU8_9MYCO|nr:anthrone oxygenase family protein [Mycolicibacterium arseniciresistens]MDO3639989.1 DUF1772 domain-containing protein [Mycolicibacterium arseniciresistens]
MSLNPVVALTVTAAIAAAVVGGVFYAFSTIVMRGLDRTGPVAAITAMRGMNAEAQANGPFLLVFVGSALLSAAVVVVAVVRIGQPGGSLLLAGGVAGVAGFAITMAFNVPLNNHLDTVDPTALGVAEATREWAAYLSTWTAWNHVRAAAGIAAAVLMALGLNSGE